MYTVHPVQLFLNSDGISYKAVPDDASLLNLINWAHNADLGLDIMVGDMLGGSQPSPVSYNATSLSYNVSHADEKSINQPKL